MNLPKPLATTKPAGTLSWNRLPPCGQDRGDAGADGLAADERDVADLHAVDIGDRVERARWEDADADAGLAGARAGLGGSRQRQDQRGG